MSTYKVIQDIEAEDHVLGPFSFRQFVYLLISLFFGYITIVVLIKGLAFLVVLFLPFVLFFGFLAFPFIKDQPTEVWALAKIRFLTKTRKRLWNQSGIKNTVTITAPKKPVKQLTNNLDDTEVRSRLKRLSETIDSRGWVVKNVSGPIMQIGQIITDPDESDRLIMPTDNIPNESESDNKEFDILDSHSNPTASNIDTIIAQTETNHRQKLMNLVNDKSNEQTDEAKLYEDLIKQKLERQTSTAGLKNIPLKPTVIMKENPPKTETPKNNSVKNAIINFANNDNLSLQTISKEINKHNLDEEVVISLR